MKNVGQEPGQGEECVSRDPSRSVSAMKIEAAEAAWRRRVGQEHGIGMGLDPEHGIEEVKRACHVPPGPELADHRALEKGSIELAWADLVSDRAGLGDDGLHLAVPLAAAGVAVLPESPAQVLGLADVDDLALLVEHPIHAG